MTFRSVQQNEQCLDEANSANISIGRQDQLLLLPTNVISVQMSDIQVVKMLGRGSFCSVHQVYIKQPNASEDNLYALKSLRDFPTKTPSVNDCNTANTDLVNEAGILSKLCHENIIQFHGVHSSNHWGFCIILEMLKETLEDHLNHWRRQKLPSFDIFQRSRLRKTIHLANISKIAVEIANGMDYLHKNQIVMRDLKPANVGFDENGTVRIFDFGMARCLGNCDRFHTAYLSGTLRYMAPEAMVPTNNGIGLSSDVYSFGILLWELYTLRRPYQNIAKKSTVAMFVHKVAEEHRRPSMRFIYHSRVRSLIQQCCDSDEWARPSFNSIRNDLSIIMKHKEIKGQ